MIKHITLYSLLLLLVGAALSGCSDSVAVNQPQGSDNAYKIVYARYDWANANTSIPEMMMVDTSGKNTNRILTGWPTGTATNKILFAVAGPSFKAAGIYISDNNGVIRGPIYVSDTAHMLQQFPALSADGSTVVFSLRDTGANAKYHVAVVKTDGTGFRILGEECYETQPGISADGQWISYYSGTGSDTSLVVARSDGSATNKIVHVQETMVDFAGESQWNPAGDRIAYTDNGHVYVVNPDGTGRIDVAVGLQPRWTPGHSGLLAYVQSEDKLDWDIFITGDLGVTSVNLTQTNAQWELYPQWSPDGRYIVCQTGTGDPEQSTSSIKLIEIATGATRTLGTPGALPFFTR